MLACNLLLNCKTNPSIWKTRCMQFVFGKFQHKNHRWTNSTPFFIIKFYQSAKSNEKIIFLLARSPSDMMMRWWHRSTQHKRVKRSGESISEVEKYWKHIENAIESRVIPRVKDYKHHALSCHFPRLPLTVHFDIARSTTTNTDAAFAAAL